VKGFLESVVGIFRSRTAVENALIQLLNHGIPSESTTLLTPEGLTPERLTAKSNVETIDQSLEKIPTTDAEADGMGMAVGALLGGGVGASAGLAGGAATASLFVPGVGIMFAAGLGAAALLGLGGAALGARAGEITEHTLDTGVPRDDISFYREVLGGRSLIIANVDDGRSADTAKSVMEQSGGETVAHVRKELNSAA
jgi:hypothetical protein